MLFFGCKSFLFRCLFLFFREKMSIYHDEVEIEDMEYDEETETYYYPCPCGDRFQITKVLINVVFICLSRIYLLNFLFVFHKIKTRRKISKTVKRLQLVQVVHY